MKFLCFEVEEMRDVNLTMAETRDNDNWWWVLCDDVPGQDPVIFFIDIVLILAIVILDGEQ